MDMTSAWQEYFRKWPAELERRGVVVTAFDEQIPFDGFATSEHLLLLERKIPDTLGARKILLSYGQIMAVKITDVVKMKAFLSLGFADPTAKRSNPT
ncbi:MAG TPA: hypothetical protein VHY91_12820 [Pirellulales bacterium]|jgi:hypothetical protein|nr:hypothetical protein [Pirellulales bacterium]